MGKILIGASLLPVWCQIRDEALLARILALVGGKNGQIGLKAAACRALSLFQTQHHARR